jgi:5-formyltetrahydrofolate cyclo-ligase
MNKSDLRKVMLLKRKSMKIDDAKKYSKCIFEKIKNTNILNFSNILAYSDFKNEVITKDIIKFLLENKREVYLPKCDVNTKTFEPVKIQSENFAYDTNVYGISEPADEKESIKTTAIDCAIIPGIAFDINGNRIGFGSGYYDKFLNINPLVYKIGLCYEFQLTKDIIPDEFDIPMDIIITEKRVVFCDKTNR